MKICLKKSILYICFMGLLSGCVEVPTLESLFHDKEPHKLTIDANQVNIDRDSDNAISIKVFLLSNKIMGRKHKMNEMLMQIMQKNTLHIKNVKSYNEFFVISGQVLNDEILVPPRVRNIYVFVESKKKVIGHCMAKFYPNGVNKIKIKLLDNQCLVTFE